MISGSEDDKNKQQATSTSEERDMRMMVSLLRACRRLLAPAGDLLCALLSYC
jgi:hypothetical protein